MYNLDTMPKVAMEQILKHCCFMEINALRKTCTYTRRLVDLIKPDLEITYLDFSLASGRITMTPRYSHSEEEEKGVVYEITDDGCSVCEYGRARKFFTNTMPAEMFYQDFKILFPFLMHQKKPLDYWRMCFGVDGFAVFQRTMGRVLAEFNAQLRTEHFSLFNTDRPHLTTMLPLMCAKTLTRLSITNESRHVDEALDLSQVAELAQWKSVRRLRLAGCLPDTLSRLQQFSNSWVSCGTVAPDAIVSLREALRNAPLFNACTLHDYLPSHRDEVRSALFPRDSDDSILYFSTTTPEYVLSVEPGYHLRFKRIPRSSLNHDDIVMD